MSPKFLYKEPPLPLTYSFRHDVACRYEHPISSTNKEQNSKKSAFAETNRNECPYRKHCVDMGQLQPLVRAYGNRVAVTLTESSSNIVARSENHFHGEQQHRMSLRKHIYEVHATSEARRYCRPDIQSLRKLVDQLRSEPQVRLIHSLLQERIEQKLPDLPVSDLKSLVRFLASIIKYATTDPVSTESIVKKYLSHHVGPFQCNGLNRLRFAKYLGFVDLRTNSPRSPIAIGLLAFPRALRHDREATLISGLYGNFFGGPTFACTPFSMHDPATGGAYCAQACLIMVLTLLSDRGANILGSYDLTIEALQDNAKGRNEYRVFPVKGLRMHEMEKVLNSRAGNASATARQFKRFGNGSIVLNRLIDAYVSARCPVIVGVDGATWNKRATGSPHSLVIIGVRRSKTNSREITDLIVHDPSRGPYMRCSYDEYLHAALPLDNLSNPVLFCGDRTIEVHASDCIDYIKTHGSQDYAQYLTLNTPEFKKYLADHNIPVCHVEGADFEVRLLDRDDIYHALSLESATENLTDSSLLHDKICKLPVGWYWCVALHGLSGIHVLWVFSTKRKEVSDTPDTQLHPTDSPISSVIERFPVSPGKA